MMHVKGRVANVDVRTAAERYRIRDARAMFFKASKACKKEKVEKSKKKVDKKAKRKVKSRLWSDKERREWVRAYYDKHYGKSKEGGVEWKAGELNIMEYHADDKNSSLDTTLPFTPTKWSDLDRYMQLEKQHRHNLQIFDPE